MSQDVTSSLSDVEDKVSSINFDTIEPYISDYALLEVIGSGFQGTVFKATHKKTDKIVAIKYM